MSNFGRPLPSHLRNQSLGGSQQQSPVLLARIAEKKAELANLKDKLSTLSDGTEAVAAVLSNWHNVLRAINMASTKLPKSKDEEEVEKKSEDGPPLPQTLVRIPTQHAPTVIEQANTANAEE